MITQGKWEATTYLVHAGSMGCTSRFICECIRSGSVDSDEAEANARLIAAAPDLLKACKELADIFPENSMSEMDAADFKDRATRIWVASQSAKNIIAKAE